MASLPLRIARAPAARTVRGRAAGVADALLQGRGWIALVAVLLVGIVFFNVDLLQMNRDIAQTAGRAAAVKRQNAGLKLRLARLASSERIQHAAEQRGFVLPLPGQIRYLRANRAADGRLAARRMTAPGKGEPQPAATAPAAPPAQPPSVPQPATAPPTTTAPPSQPAAPQPAAGQPQAQPQATPPTAGPTGAPAAPQG